MPVTVLTGQALELHHQELIQVASQAELKARLKDLLATDRQPKYMNDTQWYFASRRVIPNRREPEYRRTTPDFLNDYPDIALALIDLIEAMREVGRFRGWLKMRGFWGHSIFRMQRLRLHTQFVEREAYRVAAEVESATEIVRLAYGRDVMSNIDLQVDVIEPPTRISPRDTLKSLEAARRSCSTPV